MDLKRELDLTLTRRQLFGLASKGIGLGALACLLEGDPGPGVAIGALDQIIKAQVPKLAGCRAWLCGDPELVRVLKKKLFLGGMSLNQINADLFLPAAS